MKNKTLENKIPLESPSTEGSLKSYVVKMFLAGTLVILPLMIIYLILSLIFDLVFEFVSPISHILNPGQAEPHWIIDVIALVFLGTIIFALGLLVDHRRGRKTLKGLETQYLSKLPLYSTIRETVNQFSELKSMPFSQVVLIDPFGTGALMTGFVTEKINEEIYTIFVPTAPNPTNGNIYHIPVKQIKFLEVSSDLAMRSIVGMGTGSTCLFQSNAKNQELIAEIERKSSSKE